MAGRHNRTALAGACLALPTAFLVACSSAPAPEPTIAPIAITITVAGSAHDIRPYTTLGEALQQLHIQPVAGRLVSIRGRVLRPSAEPGEVFLNGATTPDGTVLRAGDTITLVNGVDKVEGTIRKATMLPGKRPGDPEYSLARWRIKRVEVVGRTSGDVAMLRFVPIGEPTVRRQVALTFDDGPWPRYTREIVRVLKRHHAKATFFMIGENVSRWPSIARQVVRAGMVVGNHSWDHPLIPPFGQLTHQRVQAELSRTSDILRTVGVEHPSLFRPPGGDWSDQVVQQAEALGLRVVNWNVDPQDWRASRSPKQIARIVLSQVRPGAIVDLHDGGGNQRATAKALPRIIRGLRRRHLKLVTIPL